VIDCPAYHDRLTDGQAVVIKGKRTTPVLLVRRLVAVQPVRVRHVITDVDTFWTIAFPLPRATIGVMPELPEVETVVRVLRPMLVGRTIQTASFPRPTRSMTNLPHEAMASRIVGQSVQAVERRAKYLLFRLDRDTLIVHLKMTGHLYVVPVGEMNPFDRWLRVHFPLDDGRELRFSDSRRFGRVYLCGDPAEVLPDLGPEPLEDSFTAAAFQARLNGRSGVLKALLLDQSFIAGVGNIYADEALHQARLHPLRKADSLSTKESTALHSAIRAVLNAGIAHNGATIGWYRDPQGAAGEMQNHFKVYRARGNEHLPCPDCGTPITTIRVGGRGTHFCPTCQPAPKDTHPKKAVKAAKVKGGENVP